MKDITPRVLRYREAARQLWNNFLRERHTIGYAISSDDALDDWLLLKRRLFVALVLRHTGDDSHVQALLDPERFSFWNDPLPFLRVVLSAEVIGARITRTPGRCGYWDHPVKRLGPDDTLQFIDFFDWGQAGYLDFQYFQVEVASSPRHPEIVGHQALIDVRHAAVFVDTRPTKTARRQRRLSQPPTKARASRNRKRG